VVQKRGFHFSLARQYDKVIAVVVLAALLGSLFLLARSAAESKERKLNYDNGVRNMRPKMPNLTPASTSLYEMGLRALRQPQILRLSGTNEAGLFTPQQRVWCVDCLYPITYASAECSFCGFKQPAQRDAPSIEPLDPDPEGKGIPNSWRKKYFNQPFALAENQSRWDDDADEDGFINLKEFEAGTSPRDANDHPDWIQLVRFKELTTRQYPFIFTGVNKMPGGEMQLVLNMKGGDDRTYWVKRGEFIGKTGFIYSNCTQKIESVVVPGVGGFQKLARYEAELLRPADGKTFVLRDNEPHAKLEQDLALTLTIAGKTAEYHAATDGFLDMEGEKYKVVVNLGVDDKPISVVLENVRSGKKTIVTVGSL
jgi:hypothetical protein